MKDEKKFSFENDLLRLPGQSATDELNEIIDSKVDGHLFMIAASVMLILFTWVVHFEKVEPNPYVVTLTALILILVSSLKLRKYKRDIINLKQGIKGERYVGQILEGLRADGYQVFHDIVAESFNLDHVIIGPAGIFVIETKTWGNKAEIGSAKYDGKTLYLNNHPVPRNPIMQSLGSARWLSDTLRKSTGTQFRVKPLIALPSKFIKSEVNKVLEKEGVYMLNPKNIKAFLGAKKDSEILSAEQISQVSFHLSRIIASTVSKN